MAQRRTNAESPSVEVRVFTADEIEQGIEKIRRRISALEGLDPSQVRYNDASVRNVESDIRNTIGEVFGPNSSEFGEHKQFRIRRGPISSSRSDAEKQEQFILEIPQKITRLKGLISRLEEKRLDLAPERGQGPRAPSSDIPDECKGHCPECGEDRNASILASHKEHQDLEPTGHLWTIDNYRILRCLGCSRVYVQREHLFSEDEEVDWDPQTGESEWVLVPNVTYWPPPEKRKRPAWLNQLDDGTLRDLLKETYSALDADLDVLAAIGTRTALDRAMVLNGAEVASRFEEKLKELGRKGVISERESRTLGTLISAGSAAAHRAWKPTAEELETLIAGVEGFVNRTLVLQKAVDAMKDTVPPKPPRPTKTKGSSKS